MEEVVVVVVVVEVDEKAAVVTVGEDGPSSASLFCLLPMRFVGAFFFPGWAPPPPPPRSSYRRVSQISQFERLYELRNVHAAHDHCSDASPARFMSAVPSRCGETEGGRKATACQANAARKASV